MPSLGYEALLGLGALLLIIAPFSIYWKQRKELQQKAYADWRMSFDSLLDLKFGDGSPLTREEQWLAALNEFDRLEGEILGGDFSHKYAMLAYKDIVLKLLRSAPPLHYSHYQKRAIKIVEVINEHDAHAKS